jgi:acyl-coenzyme A synthetase/AMP-(fatty) acid ligase
MPNPSVVTNSPVPIMCYEQLLDHAVGGLASFRWPRLDEGTPCGLCYTSGTTGNPKVGHSTNFAVDVLCSFMTGCMAMFTGCGVLWGGVLAAGA